MCGIIGYLGPKPAKDILIEGLKRLDYRGYHAAGIALCHDGSINVHRAVGEVKDLEAEIEDKDLSGSLGIGHTRWPTHGKNTLANTHPHLDESKKIAIVHNGLVENHDVLRKFLANKGITFLSETDSEVAAQLIGYIYNEHLKTNEPTVELFKKSVIEALQKIDGAYALVIICDDFPEAMIVAKKGSPLILGLGNEEFIVASDAPAIINYTSQVIHLRDNEIAVIEKDGYKTYDLDHQETEVEVEVMDMEIEEIRLGDFSCFMEKEIFTQPQAIQACFEGRIDLRDKEIILSGIHSFSREIIRAKKITIIACGTAWHAALVGKYIIEELCRIPVEVDYASEFRYRNPIIQPEDTLLIAVSQSGETLDTLEALKEGKTRGAFPVGIVNVPGSQIARETECGVYLRVGREIGVASTKAFTGQLTVLLLLALFIARRKSLSKEILGQYLNALDNIPRQVDEILHQSEDIKKIAEEYINCKHWLFLGRGSQFPIALEGALKLKEISYLYAEGLSAAEMKHGPIALIDKDIPSVFLAPQNSHYGKTMSNLEEIRGREGKIIAIATSGDEEISRKADHVIYVPPTLELLQPLLTVIPLQLLAYHAAVILGRNVDKPRNLAKSVTVE